MLETRIRKVYDEKLVKIKKSTALQVEKQNQECMKVRPDGLASKLVVAFSWASV